MNFFKNNPNFGKSELRPLKFSCSDIFKQRFLFIGDIFNPLHARQRDRSVQHTLPDGSSQSDQEDVCANQTHRYHPDAIIPVIF